MHSTKRDIYTNYGNTEYWQKCDFNGDAFNDDLERYWCKSLIFYTIKKSKKSQVKQIKSKNTKNASTTN